MSRQSKDPERFIHGEIKAFQTLGSRAIDYAQQIMIAEHSSAPIGSAPVTDALGALKHAAVGYALMMILSENLLSVEEIQRIDNVLTDRLNEDVGTALNKDTEQS